MADDPQHDMAAAIMQLEVTNNNDFPIQTFFDGIPLNFMEGETITITPEQANHCFGYPGEFSDMALYMAKRYGWSGSDYLVQKGEREPVYRQLARKIVIKPVYYELVRRDRNAPIPADDGSEEDLPPEPVGESDTGTKVGRRRRTATAKITREKRGRRQDRDTADVKLRSPRR